MEEDISADDALEGTRIDPLNAHVGREHLEEDNDTPAAPASTHSDLPPDHPSHDSEQDSNEVYQEGE